jgi:hypothetical protein
MENESKSKKYVTLTFQEVCEVLIRLGRALDEDFDIGLIVEREADDSIALTVYRKSEKRDETEPLKTWPFITRSEKA